MTQLTTSTSRKLQKTKGVASMNKLFKPITLGVGVLMILGLAACGQGVENRDAPPEPRSRAAVAEDVEVTYFRDTIYASVFRVQQCRDCHVTGGGGNGAFADDNVNTAFSVASTKFNPASITFDENGNVVVAPNAPDPFLSSTFATKVGTGQHYCWGGSCSDSAQEIADALRAWAVAFNQGGTLADNTDPAPVPKDILTDPPSNPPTAPITFNDNVNMFTAVYDLVTREDQGYCSRCHSSTTTENPPQRPFFAETGYANAKEVAYQQVKDAGVVNLGQPGASKLVVRPWPGQHNCGGNCQALAANIQQAIADWSAAIQGENPTAEFNENGYLLPSTALTLGDGQITSGGARYDDYVIAKYEFKEGSDDDSTNDNVARDTSGVEPTIDLRLFGDVRWVGGYGLEFGMGGQARSISVAQSQKLHDLIVARGEYSIEAWVIPDNTSQEGDQNIESTVIMSYSSGTLNRNFTLGQDAYQYKFRNRVVDANGSVLDTDMNENLVQTSLQHVVMTYSEADGRRIYVNGEPKACETDTPAPSGEFTSPCPTIDDGEKDNAELSQWDPGYLLTLGSDTNGDNQWLGKIKFAAIHRKALTQREIKINYDAGVGQKFNLLFNISDFAGQSGWNGAIGSRSYIWFEVAEYDDYSYLFSEPKFIDLSYSQPTPSAVDFDFCGMRVGVNGKEATVGQAFINLGKFGSDCSDPSSGLRISSADPVSLTRLQGEQHPDQIAPASGTVIPKDIDVSTDQFFLTFEMIGGLTEDTRTRPAQVFPSETIYTSTSPAFVVGLRTFDEINATMSALTGVSSAAVVNDDASDDALKGFNTLKGQLPDSENVSGFLPSHQTAIASLAGRYCHLRVENTTPDGTSPEAYFNVTNGFFDSGSTTTTAFPNGSDSTSISDISDAIISNMVRDVGTLDISVIKPELKALAGVLLEELPAKDTETQPHQCQTSLNNGAITQDCSGVDRVKSIVKAMCTAVLASAVVTEQ